MKPKFIYYLIFFVLIHFSATAQLRNQGWIVGGDFGFSSANNTTFIGVAPEVGYLFDSNVELGGSVGYTLITSGSIKRHLWNFGPYVNYFISDSFFLRGRYQHLRGKETGTSNTDFRITESSLWLGGGYQTINNGLFYRVGILYNTLYDENTSIYNSPFLPYASLGFQL